MSEIKFEKDVLNDMYMKINKKVTEYIIDNEESMMKNELSMEEQDILMIYEKFAYEEIKQKLKESEPKFETYNDQQQKANIKIIKRELDKLMSNKIKENMKLA